VQNCKTGLQYRIPSIQVSLEDWLTGCVGGPSRAPESSAMRDLSGVLPEQACRLASVSAIRKIAGRLPMVATTRRGSLQGWSRFGDAKFTVQNCFEIVLRLAASGSAVRVSVLSTQL
jgi:hypothetical protein